MIGDCTLCDGSVKSDGIRETCTRCGNSQKPIAPEPDHAEIRAAVRASRRRRLLAPACFGRRHHQCKASRCECLCHDKEAARGAQA